MGGRDPGKWMYAVEKDELMRGSWRMKWKWMNWSGEVGMCKVGKWIHEVKMNIGKNMTVWWGNKCSMGSVWSEN